MAPGQKKAGEGGGMRRPDATLSFGVREPLPDSSLFISPPLRLYTLRAHLAKFTLVHSKDPAGFNFTNFARNIRGLKYVELEGRGYEVLFTRTSAFLTFQGMPGILASLAPVIGGEAIGRVNIISGKDGEFLTVCRITGRELGALLGAAASAKSGAFMPDSILPADPSADISPEEFGKRLASCTVVTCDGRFDLADFARKISIVSAFRDENDAVYFVIGLKGDDSVYSLYVNMPGLEASEQNPLVARLEFNYDSLALFRVDVIG